ncbi:CBS domain-containing protein [Pyxidicoccus caerfyrddinensis]|uniref:CBS domain-containing protein n=1 Tax=Pyxidicoccus caerfyrddinensis TaxID=2709663 RepID=UPI0013DD3434|nr:CBS domain-containing protein [Pyxidicoccus caerfyrddinensis]
MPPAPAGCIPARGCAAYLEGGRARGVPAIGPCGVRRLPIVDGQGRVAGLVSLDDVLVLLSAELGQTSAAVRENQGP